MDSVMTSFDELKNSLLEAAKSADIPLDEYHDVARRIVNIERQSYYGEDTPNKRLGKIREVLAVATKEETKK